MGIDWKRHLNKAQLEAVICPGGPMLVLAGAGSGKTRVLTYRIAYLIKELNVEPHKILAMTFTNKAAAEMRERVEKLVGIDLSDLWIGTFHSIFARILRREASALGYTSNYSIYDTSDQERVIKKIFEARNISTKTISPRTIQQYISSLKNKGISPEEFERENQIVNELQRAMVLVYPEYEIRMRMNNAMDFDDLLLNMLRLLQEREDLKEKYQRMFSHILIDEYQDTNTIQYEIIRILAAKHRNLFVVGDDDQSIYKWRGAEVRNIFRFLEDFPDARQFRLEQNYRSTQAILDVANNVIKHNTQRLEKTLWTDLTGNQPKPVLLECANGIDEAHSLVRLIQEWKATFGYDYYDFAILYRTNAQSRIFEEAFRKNNVPYMIFGGIRFFDRREIRDILAYLRVIVNADDEVSLERIINVPPRKIGQKTVEKLIAVSRRENRGITDILQNIDQFQEDLISIQPLKEFFEMLENWKRSSKEIHPADLVNKILQDTRLLEYYSRDSLVDYQDREENIQQFIAGLYEFFANRPIDEHSLEEYLQYISLISDVDNPQGNAGGVKLMTIHSAKGLEFPVVIVAGLEERLFPHQLSLESEEELEEERRLFYVAVTRAKERLVLSYARARTFFQSGMEETRKRSRFLEEIPPDLVQFSATTYHSGSSMGYGSTSGFQPGDWVIHPQYGRGQIVGVEGRGAREKVSIVFEDNRLRQFFTAMVKFEREN